MVLGIILILFCSAHRTSSRFLKSNNRNSEPLMTKTRNIASCAAALRSNPVDLEALTPLCEVCCALPLSLSKPSTIPRKGPSAGCLQSSNYHWSSSHSLIWERERHGRTLIQFQCLMNLIHRPPYQRASTLQPHSHPELSKKGDRC